MIPFIVIAGLTRNDGAIVIPRFQFINSIHNS
jgi:hypothetical protein